MATIVTRKGKRGVRYQVRIHRHGIHQSATFSTRDAARTWAQMVEGYAAAHGAGLVPEGVAGHSVAEAIERYRREVLPRKGPGTQQSYDGHLRWWRRRLGSMSLADLRSSEILVHRDRLARHRSPATVNRYLASLSAVLSAAMLDWEWLEASPMARVRALPEPRGRVRYLTAAERPMLLEAVQASHEPYLAVVVWLAIATGARKGELLGLRWRDVDWTRQQLVFHETKNKERRTVPVRGEAWTRLVDWAGGVARIGPDWVFPRPAGTKPLDIRYAWEQARAKAELEDFRFHDLRHSTASYLAMSGASMVEIAEVLGHKTLQMVRRYAHLSEAHTAGVLERMVGRFLE
jgi:integrase